MLERLLESSYSALDRHPHPEVAFRAQHPGGLKWRVRDRVLTTSTEAGDPVAVIGLRGKTIAEVIALLAAAGCTIVYQSAEHAGRAADTLLAGMGRQVESDGDQFRVYSSLLWSVMDAYATELEDAALNVEAAVRQLYIGTADGEWLDVWGDYFAIPRDAGEEDEAYRVRILVETMRTRVNAMAIEKAVRDMTGKDVTIFEPWQDLFVLSDRSELGGRYRMYDGDFYSPNVIQPLSATPLDWSRPLEIIDRNRPAGTIVKEPAFAPRLRFASFFPDGLPAQSSGYTSLHGGILESTSPTALGALRLSDYEELLNYRCNLFDVHSFRNTDGANSYTRVGPPLYFVKASVCLSEDAELGSLNCTFGHYFRTDESDFIVLSGDADTDAYALSDSVVLPSYVSFEEVRENVIGAVVQSPFTPAALSSRVATMAAQARRVPTAVWVGVWDDRIWNATRIWSNRVDW